MVNFIFGFVVGVISFAIVFNIIHKKMVDAFQKAVDYFKSEIENVFNGIK